MKHKVHQETLFPLEYIEVALDDPTGFCKRFWEYLEARGIAPVSKSTWFAVNTKLAKKLFSESDPAEVADLIKFSHSDPRLAAFYGISDLRSFIRHASKLRELRKQRNDKERAPDDSYDARYPILDDVASADDAITGGPTTP